MHSPWPGSYHPRQNPPHVDGCSPPASNTPPDSLLPGSSHRSQPASPTDAGRAESLGTPPAPGPYSAPSDPETSANASSRRTDTPGHQTPRSSPERSPPRRVPDGSPPTR